MNAATPQQMRDAIDQGWPMRLGHKLKRTLYLRPPADDGYEDDICVGIVDSEELAEAIMIRWNMHVAHQGLYR